MPAFDEEFPSISLGRVEFALKAGRLHRPMSLCAHASSEGDI